MATLPEITIESNQGSGRPYVLLHELDGYQALIEVLAERLSAKSQVLVLATSLLEKRTWISLTDKLKGALDALKIRQASFVAFGPACWLLQNLSLSNPRFVRSAVIVDPTSRPHPTLWLRLLDRLEAFLPLGLPLRVREKALNMRPFLHRLRYPVLVVSSSQASAYQREEARVFASRLSCAWHVQAPRSSDDTQSEIEFLVREIVPFQDTPARCPQKNRPRRRVVITVDGLAGSGKTTLSKELAKRLGFSHLNSGELYRSVAWLACSQSISASDVQGLVNLVRTNRIELQYDHVRGACAVVNGEDVTEQLHTPQISEATSQLAVHSEVREALLDAQRSAFPGANLVAEGRDMGTVIFPEADFKFFVVASKEQRVERRMKQLKGSGAADNLLKSNMEIEIEERDRRDSQRRAAPTRPAPDAVIIDNSTQTLTEVVDRMYDAVLQKGLVSPRR